MRNIVDNVISFMNGAALMIVCVRFFGLPDHQLQGNKDCWGLLIVISLFSLKHFFDSARIRY